MLCALVPCRCQGVYSSTAMIRLASPFNPWIGPLLCSMVLLVGACRLTPPPPSQNANEALIVAGIDTVDTTQALPASLLEGLQVDSLQVARVPPDSLAPDEVAASLAALRAEVARLRDDIRTLETPSRNGPLARLLNSEADSVRADTSNAPIADAAKEAAQDVRQFGGKFILATLIMLLTMFLIRGMVSLLETLAERSAARRLFFKKLIPIVRLLTWSLATYFVLSGVFNLDRSSLLAAATALGVAIGFAAQDVLKNIFGGIIIIFDQPFQVGDKISVGGTYGEVVSIGLRSTRIVTPDDNLVSVPNSQVVEGQVANANAGALDCQVVVDLYLPGWTDVRKAKALAYSAAANSRYVYLDKPIVVNVKDVFKETFLTQLKVKAYVLDTRYEFIFASDVTEAAKSEFLRHGLLYPIHDLHPGFQPPADHANGHPTAEEPT